MRYSASMTNLPCSSKCAGEYESHDGENKTEIVFGTPKTKNSRRTIPLTRTMADELTRWKQQQAQDKIRAGDK